MTPAWPRATPRKNALQALKGRLPELIGGSADLSELQPHRPGRRGRLHAPSEAGRNIRFGVREHAMGAIANGIAYHGGLLPYVGTFLNFSDYMRGAVRLAALSGLHVTYVWTHDSVGVGEDGPTHQPVEHYAALRAMPNLTFVRPGDPNEASAAWAPGRRAPRRAGGPGLHAPEAAHPARHGRAARATASAPAATSSPRPPRPTARSRPPSSSSSPPARSWRWPSRPARSSTAEGIRTRVVSMPSWERFEAQPAAYRDEVLPRSVTARVSIEAGVSLGWERWVGDRGRHHRHRPLRALGARPSRSSNGSASPPRTSCRVARGVLAGEIRGVVSAAGEHAGQHHPRRPGGPLMDTTLTLPAALQGHRRRGHRPRRRRALGEPPLGARHEPLDAATTTSRTASGHASAGSTRRPPSRPRRPS